MLLNAILIPIYKYLYSACSMFLDIMLCYLPLNIIKYGVSKDYAGSQVSDRCHLATCFNETAHISFLQATNGHSPVLEQSYLLWCGILTDKLKNCMPFL